MSRILVTLAPSVLILVVCSWLVQLEGQSYRHRFLETAPDELAKRLVQAEKLDPPRTLPTETEELRKTPTTAKGSSGPRIPVEVVSAPAGRSGNSVADDPRRRGLTERDSTPLGRQPEEPATPPTSFNDNRMRPGLEGVPSSKPRRPEDPVSSEEPPKLTRDEEAKIGRSLHEVIIRHHQALGEEAEPAFLNHLYKLSAPLKPKDLAINFDLIESNGIFVFSHVGGYIYLSRRLTKLIPDDVELEFIIAHEMCHLEKRHGIECVASEIGAQGVRPDQPGLVQRLYHQVAAGYDPRQEYEADAWACQRLMNLGRSPHGILSFLRRLENYEVRNPRVGPIQPETPLDAEFQNVERHWRTHPRIPLRLDRLQEMTEPARAKPVR